MKSLIQIGGLLLFLGGCGLTLRLIEVARMSCPHCHSEDLTFLRHANESACYSCNKCNAYVVDRGSILARYEDMTQAFRESTGWPTDDEALEGSSDEPADLPSEDTLSNGPDRSLTPVAQ